MKNIINSMDINLCNGCGSCANVCPQYAIKMKENKKGFYYPEIDSEKCVSCGLCKNACSLNYSTTNSNSPKIFAGIGEDVIREKSSSGGMFTILANYIIENGGVVCGAAFDSDFSVNHIIIDNLDDLDQLRTSKYVQSNIGNVFAKIKEILRADKKVLFVGTPCQVAGLLNFLKEKSENLYTIDLICNGVPSYKALNKYLKEECNNEEIKKINFRGKNSGWNYNFCFNIETNKSGYSIPVSKSNYLLAFVRGLSSRDSCYYCKFATIPRVGDITLGDFWGIKKFAPKFDDRKGTSLILVNNDKGNELLQYLKMHCKKIKEFSKNTLNNSPRLFYPIEPHPKRLNFWEDFDNLGFNENVKNNLEGRFDCAILNFWWTNNYGAVLTAFALQTMIRNLGYSSVLVKYIFGRDAKEVYYNKLSDMFARKYLTTTLLCNKTKLKNLNNITDKFIVGSDQVFRYKYTKDYLGSLFLNFTDYDKTKIAFSASFGTAEFNCKSKELREYKFLLSRFDDITVREISGINLCENIFGIKATQIIDPVFAIDNEVWEQLIKDSSINTTKYLLAYVLDNSPQFIKKIKDIAQSRNLEAVFVDENNSIQDWLYLFKNATSIITDSFHGMCFSVIFNKQFTCLLNRSRGVDRFETIREILNLPDCMFVEDIEDIKAEEYECNYENINSLICIQKQKCISKLKQSLEISKKGTAKDAEDDKRRMKKYITLSFQKRIMYGFKKIAYKTFFKISKKNKYKQKYLKYKNKLSI